MGPGLTGHVSIHSQQLVYTPTDKEGHRHRALLREVATFTRLIDFCTAWRRTKPSTPPCHFPPHPSSSTPHHPALFHSHFLILSFSLFLYLLLLPSHTMTVNGTFTEINK